jgi:hypothetical protein
MIFHENPVDESGSDTCGRRNTYDEVRSVSCANAVKQWVDIDELQHIIGAIYPILYTFFHDRFQNVITVELGCNIMKVTGYFM